MVHNLVFPSTLTEEELHLKKMFELLRKIKNAKNCENEHGNVGTTMVIPSSNSSTSKMKPKKGIETAQATTEQVKKLVKTGAMTIAKTEEKLTFKRSSQLDKKLKDNEFLKIRRPNNATKNAGNSSNEDDNNGAGKTIYVRGYDLMEEPLTAGFSRFGKILRVHIEDRRRSAFVDFETDAQALNAIKEMDGNMVNGVTLRVSMARRQNYNPKRAAPWSTNDSAKKPKFDNQGDFEDKREMIMYDDDDF